VSISVYQGHDKDKSTFLKYNAAQVTTRVLATTLEGGK